MIRVYPGFLSGVIRGLVCEGLAFRVEFSLVRCSVSARCIRSDFLQPL